MDDAVLADLHERLARTRIPDEIPGTGWEYGMPADYLADLVAYWRDTFDWRAQEARLNRFPQFRTMIDGQSIHFLHARSPHATRCPLLLTHGWPGSIVEFLAVIHPLTHPERHGGDAARRLPRRRRRRCPATAFSAPTRDAGWDADAHRARVRQLMARLGYDALRRAGRRLGRAGRDPHRRGRSGALRGDCT